MQQGGPDGLWSRTKNIVVHVIQWHDDELFMLESCGCRLVLDLGVFMILFICLTNAHGYSAVT